MPILNYGRPDNWSLVTELSQGEIFIFRQFIYDAKKKFKYKDDRDFLRTLTPNMDFSKPYIYAFDATLCRREDQLYINKLQDLLGEANELMGKKYKNYKLDIKGTWSTGYIVVMEYSKTKNKNSLKELTRQSMIKKFQDFGILPDTQSTKDLGKGLI